MERFVPTDAQWAKMELTCLDSSDRGSLRRLPSATFVPGRRAPVLSSWRNWRKFFCHRDEVFAGASKSLRKGAAQRGQFLPTWSDLAYCRSLMPRRVSGNDRLDRGSASRPSPPGSPLRPATRSMPLAPSRSTCRSGRGNSRRRHQTPSLAGVRKQMFGCE
jgi:hypothetical protein